MKRGLRYGVVAWTLACAGCASAPPGSPAKKAPVERASEEKPYDFRAEGDIPPLAADARNEPDVEEIGVTDTAIDVTEAEVPPDSTRRDETALVDGFRVQVFASADRDVAESASREAAQRLQLAAYVDMEAGVYKVRVGDFVSRPDAERALAAIRRQYADAWVVTTKVRGAP